MTKHPRSVTWHGVGVQTAAQLQRMHRRLDRNRKAAAAVLTKMQHGQSLNLSFERGCGDGCPTAPASPTRLPRS
jgi:hypothetical protein